MSLNFIGPINKLSYGITAWNLITQLRRSGKEVSLFPIDKFRGIETDLHTIEIAESLNRAKFFDVKANCVRLWHQNDMQEFVGKGEHIGFPIFELDAFDKLELHNLNSCDRLLVPSLWAKDVCIANNIHSQIDVVPLGVDRSIFCETNISMGGPTIFFNIGKWELRKGHDLLAKAFSSAFSKYDNVLLFLLCDNPFLPVQEKSNWLNSFKHPGVRAVSRLTSSQEVANLINSSDCGVFPSRAEGWNLPALETLSCGRHLIISNYSAHTEYVNETNSLLLESKGTEPANDNKWFHGQGNWSKLSLEELVEAMRSIHKRKQNLELEINKAGISTANSFTWKESARKLYEYSTSGL